MGGWEPKAGEQVRFRVRREGDLHPAVPREGTGMVVRDIRRNRAESCDYEIMVDFHGRLCFYRAELLPLWWHNEN